MGNAAAITKPRRVTLAENSRTGSKTSSDHYNMAATNKKAPIAPILVSNPVLIAARPTSLSDSFSHSYDAGDRKLLSYEDTLSSNSDMINSDPLKYMIVFPEDDIKVIS